MKKLALRLAIVTAFAVAAVLIVTNIVPPVSGQQQTTQAIHVQVLRQADGKYVTGLKAEDFAILEDGIDQKLSMVEAVENGYKISYVPGPNPNKGFRKIIVRVALPDVSVRSVTGYYPR